MPLLGKQPVNFKTIDVIKSFKSRNIDESLPREEKVKHLRPEDKPELIEDSATIESWQNDTRHYIVGDCRGKPQAISLAQLENAFRNGGTVYLEAYYTLGRQVLKHPLIREMRGLSVTTIFLSPLSVNEIRNLQAEKVDMPRYLTYLMIKKLMDREYAMGKKLTDASLADCRKRAEDAINELKCAHEFEIFMHNHDGEGSLNWHLKDDAEDPWFLRQPDGDAAICSRSLAYLLQHKATEFMPPNCTRLSEPLFV
jgi:hypothetical protein